MQQNPVGLTLALVAVLGSQPSIAEYVAGVRFGSISPASRDVSLEVTTWYPAVVGGRSAVVGENPVFRGEIGMLDAPVADGRYPLVLVSHGAGGSVGTLGWIAGHLAASGFIVAGPNHPGTTTGDLAAADAVRIWERPEDLSALLTALVDDPLWGPHIDDRRIGAMGFSLGGHSVLAMAGVRVNRNLYAQYCDDNRTIPECAWFASNGVDLHGMDRVSFEKCNRDPRITAVVAIDASLVQAFTRESLESVAVPVHLVNLGARSSQWREVGRADEVAGMMFGGTHEFVTDAAHLSFLAECKPDGRKLLELEGETEPLCDDAAERTRTEIHSELKEVIIASFERAW